MERLIVYHDRQITPKDIEYIKTLIAGNPNKSRWYLSRELCRQWNWRQRNGSIKDMVCRGLLLKLARGGLITLPPVKRITHNPFLDRRPPEHVEIDNTPVITRLEGLKPIEVRPVRKTAYERLYDSLIHEHHYLGYTHLVGEHLKYIAFSGDRPIACMGWSSAAWYIGCRDRFIGWSPDARKKNLHLIAYHSRFLILPWIKAKFLASHLLSLCARIIPQDWQRVYNHPIYYLETFVDTERFRGVCYRASNWLYLGKTTGRGKLDQTNRKNRSIKAVFGYPLHRDFRRLLCH